MQAGAVINMLGNAMNKVVCIVFLHLNMDGKPRSIGCVLSKGGNKTPKCAC